MSFFDNDGSQNNDGSSKKRGYTAYDVAVIPVLKHQKNFTIEAPSEQEAIAALQQKIDKGEINLEVCFELFVP